MMCFKKVKILLGGLLVACGVAGIWNTTPAYAVPSADSDGWRVIESFSRALSDIQSQAKDYWVIYTGLLFLLVVFIVYLYGVQKRINREKEVLGVSPEGTSGRRAFIRSTVEQEFYYARALEKTYRKAKVINLSGGGMLFAATEEFLEGEELKVVMELFPEVVIRLRACVVRVSEGVSGKKEEDLFMMGLQFKDINNTDQDRIVKRVLREQQETIVEEKRKMNNQCVICGEALPEESVGVKIYCPNCIVYEEDDEP